MAHAARAEAQRLLEGSGIDINGSQPWDIRVHDERLFGRVLAQGTLGFGEAYMDGWWDCDQIDAMAAKLIQHRVLSRLTFTLPLIKETVKARILNKQNKRRAFQVGQVHYDLGNDLYQAMLDTRLTYTCGYWKNAKNLEEAQTAKLDLVCRKIGLKPGQHVLDIGCGWGSFAKYAAESYGARVTGVTVSKQQMELGQKRCAGLPIEFRLQDYRDIEGSFDHVISLGMFEHVGHKNYAAFFDVVRRCLKDDGLFLLHTIGNRAGGTMEPWLEKYIFPNAHLPSMRQIAAAAEPRFVMEDWHVFSTDYDKTLMAWRQNVEMHWDQLGQKYDDRFHRLWRYYLLSCAGGFRAHLNQLWQIVYSKHGVPGGYVSLR